MTRSRLSSAAAVTAAALVAAHPVLGNVFEPHGSARLVRSGSGPLFDLRALAIGGGATRSVAIRNAGRWPVLMRFSASTLGSASLATRLRIRVSIGRKTVYSGPLATLRSRALGRLSAGARRTYVFRVSLPTAGSPALDNPLQGTRVTARFTWSAVGG
ncbi:MAG: hypothetical protein E6G67_04040 [Actinobacteria bacterium]|nr:MAG: hypothetical protein E6G67_04040 [Actinomycetota bacterium]